MHTLKPTYIYRDMKPANVLVMSDGRVIIIDFGPVMVYDKFRKQDACYIGTIGYAAPEQYGGGQLDTRTDIYGIGMTLHHIVTGIDSKMPSYEVRPICMINPSLPKGLEYIIMKCIERNPDDRYQTCTELLKDLNSYSNLPKPKGLFKNIEKIIRRSYATKNNPKRYNPNKM